MFVGAMLLIMISMSGKLRSSMEVQGNGIEIRSMQATCNRHGDGRWRHVRKYKNIDEYDDYCVHIKKGSALPEPSKSLDENVLTLDNTSNTITINQNNTIHYDGLTVVNNGKIQVIPVVTTPTTPLPTPKPKPTPTPKPKPDKPLINPIEKPSLVDEKEKKDMREVGGMSIGSNVYIPSKSGSQKEKFVVVNNNGSSVKLLWKKERKYKVHEDNVIFSDIEKEKDNKERELRNTINDDFSKKIISSEIPKKSEIEILNDSQRKITLSWYWLDDSSSIDISGKIHSQDSSAKHFVRLVIEIPSETNIYTK